MSTDLTPTIPEAEMIINESAISDTTQHNLLATNDSSMLEAALWYAEHGFAVFPLHTVVGGSCTCGNPECTNTAKHPRTSKGHHDATADRGQIVAWWTLWPEANIGMPMQANGMIAVDIDPRNGGDESFAQILAEYAYPMTAEQFTGGGGRHLLFRDPGGKLPGKLADGIDLKQAGYIVVEPSLHASGRRYAWKAGRDMLLTLAAAPEWVVNGGDTKQYSLIAKAPRVVPDTLNTGERNNGLASLAGRMRNDGMSQAEIEAALLIENQRRCSPPLPEPEVKAIAASIARYSLSRTAPRSDGFVGAQLGQIQNSDWPEPAQLSPELPPVEPFDYNMLPDPLRHFVEDASDRMQVPPDFPAAALLVTLAAAVNRRASFQPKAFDSSWVVTPNLWGGIVAPPGLMKTPVIQIATAALRKIEAEWMEQFNQEMANYELQEKEWDLKISAWKDEYKRAWKKGLATPAHPTDAPMAPVARRLIVNDPSSEALHEIMSVNPNGVMLLRDELTGWLASLDRPGREGDRAFYLECWDGKTGFTVDRIGRGTIHVPACCVSLLGGIQPARLRSYLTDALHDGAGNDGLVQRFQVLVWPDVQKGWQMVDRLPSAAAMATVEKVMRKLVATHFDVPLRFAPDAQVVFNDWLTELESKVRADNLHPALIAHLSKYRSLMPTIAVLLHLTEWGATADESVQAVSIGSVQRAAGLCDYLESHARRVYSCVTTPEMRAARELATKIRTMAVWKTTGATTKIDGMTQLLTFSAREVYLKGWSGLDEPEKVKAAAEVLVDAGWLQPEQVVPKVGRSSVRYVVNPRIWRKNDAE
jgi:putative DNA primase/helicase